MLLDPKELKHIEKCIQDTKKIPLSDPKWDERVRWLHERNTVSWKTGKITVQEYFVFRDKIDKLYASRNKQLKALLEKRAASASNNDVK